MEADHLFFNGVDATTGDYLVAPKTPTEILEILRAQPVHPETRATMPEFDPRNLAESGWGVVFPRGFQGVDPAVREALAPLLDHRRAQAAAVHEHRYRELELRPGEDLDAFLFRHGRGPGPVHPDRMPYYLLLVGDPASVPFGFQTGLDIQHAVGRVCFDTLEDYERYARAVVEAESGRGQRDALVDLFAPRNTNDPVTELSMEHLVAPLAERLEGALPRCKVRRTLGERATQQALKDILGGEVGKPAFLLTASHGLGFPVDHPEQFARQGSLLCQDWPGPVDWKGPIPPEWSFAAADLPGRADISGLVAFLFACYGAGTPQFDEFAHRNVWAPRQIAPRDFLARLPQRLLQRGALAVIGHLERAWSFSYLWRDTAQVDVFESTLKLLLDGWPVGAAMEYFNQRYAELATLLANALSRTSFGELIDAREVNRLWTAHNDARGYVVEGDPAVTLTLNPSLQQDGDAEIVSAVLPASASEELNPDLLKAIAGLADLDDEALWQAARLRVPEEVSARVEDLNWKRQSTGLERSEEEELSRLLPVYERTMLVRAHSAKLLQERGYDVLPALLGE